MTTKTKSRAVVGGRLTAAAVNKMVSDLQPDRIPLTVVPGGNFETADPWKHRSAGMTCGSCMWFVKKVNANNVPTPLGRCRRRAPEMSGYPAVFTHDWCGDHKLDENKI